MGNNTIVTPTGDGTLLTSDILVHPYSLAIFFLATICLATRVRTGFQSDTRPAKDFTKPRTVPVVPYWIPWLGHTIPFVLSFQDYLKKIDKRISSNIFALRIAGGVHNIVVAPSLVKQISCRVELPLAIDDLLFYLLRNFFGDRGEYQRLITASGNNDAFWGRPHKATAGLMREPFLGRASKGTADAAGDQVWNLVSGNPSWVDQAAWEREAHVDIVSMKSDGGFVAEADLYVVLRNWISEIATTMIVGHSFMENNPATVRDLWLWENKFHTFLSSVPYWMVPGLPTAHAARERLIDAFQEHYEAMDAVLKGKDPGTRYDDLGDVPQFLWDRTIELNKLGLGARAIAVTNLVAVWAMNVNANPVIFWMIFYIYSDANLLSSIRKEIGEFVKFRKVQDSGLPVRESPKLDIDIQSLMHKCPLLKGAFYETMRLEVASSPYKSVLEDFTVTESEEDARLAGKQHPETYILKKGEMICLPNTIHQGSAKYFDDPEKFDATRFWLSPSSAGIDGDEKDKQEAIKVDYKSMRIWGGGKTMCKGRNFAEREVLIFAAAIITCWEIEPVGKKDMMKGGRWEHPGSLVAAGANNPKKDIRVKMWRRRL